MSELRQILDSTLKVKIKYEKIIGKLVCNEQMKEPTIQVIREVQQEILDAEKESEVPQDIDDEEVKIPSR